MPAESTENWKDQSSEPTDKGWRAQRGWIVTGTTDDEEARHAAPLDGRPIAQVGESHPQNRDLLCVAVPVTAGKGPLTKIVRATYQTSDGSFQSDPNPLNKKMELAVEFVTDSDVFEVEPFFSPTRKSLPFQNSAGWPFEGATEDVQDVLLTYTRNEPFFPIKKAIEFLKTVNLGPYLLPILGYMVEDCQARAMPIELGSPITADSKYATVIYRIQCRKGGWRTRTADKGTIGWYQSTLGNDDEQIKSGPFKNEFGIISEPTWLDGTGKPLNTELKVAGPGGTEFTPISKANVIPDDYKDKTAIGSVFLRYHRFVPVSYDKLL